MTTKLSRYCAGFIEASWLVALIVVPLFFNPYSSRIFEPDKITLLRSLSLLILGAWLVKGVEDKRSGVSPVEPGTSAVLSILRIPMVIPVIVLAVVYILATIFSITPGVSFWGSYQRLQGTYTTLSYLVIFAALAGNLRTRAQVERIVTSIILTSLPIALYGILQRFNLDPIAWAGDVSTRIASTMGNSIFIAAYLIMVFPLTISRIVLSFQAILTETRQIPLHLTRATAYVFIAALQVIALYMSGSRGPALGWLAGCFTIGLLLALYWRKRWLTYSLVGSAIFVGLFLVVFNLDKGPLDKLRNSPAIGRFGNLMNPESNSALVRKYIWEGTVKLVTSNKPLEFPDGHTDAFNILRPLIGYGPESMYVAYNRYYLPALGLVERRNASPDRSHNETWDSIVITGGLGLVAYMLIFGAVFYYGLKWLGLTPDRLHKLLFFGLYSAGGVIGAVFFSLWRGVEYLGVGLPFGILIGLIGFITLIALVPSLGPARIEGEPARAITLVVLLAAVVSHFVEINFGIAIGVTRTYFWVYAGLILLLGYFLPRYGEYGLQPSTGQPSLNTSGTGVSGSGSFTPSGGTPDRLNLDRNRSTSRKKRRSDRWVKDKDETSFFLPMVQEALFFGLIVTVMLVTLGYNFIGNASGSQTTAGIMWSSFARLRSDATISYGLLALVIVTWLVVTLAAVAEGAWASSRQTETSSKDQWVWLRMYAFALAISILIALVFWLFRAGILAMLVRNIPTSIAAVLNQVQQYENLLSHYYIYLFIIILLMAGCLTLRWPLTFSVPGWLSGGTTVVILLIVIWLANWTNLRVVQADMAFKSADAFTEPDSWPIAIQIYDQANTLAPAEDYYYLFLGRAYLEYARTLSSATERDSLIAQAERDLRKALALNPLNTDHTANLARLYSLWSTYATDVNVRLQRAQTSSDLFAKAVKLSPNTVRLWTEWGLVTLNGLQQDDLAYQRLTHAMEVDPSFDWTYAVMGDYYSKLARQALDEAVKNQYYEKAAGYYQQALSKASTIQLKYSYWVGLANIQTQLGQMNQAMDSYQQALNLTPGGSDNWRLELTLASLYQQSGDLTNALLHARNALNSAPNDQKNTIQDLINQLSLNP